MIFLHVVLKNTFYLQINYLYLIDEAINVGKGANVIISLLHHFFSAYGLGEAVGHLHADNCSGQNKNRHMMYYLMWQVMTGQYREIILSFFPVGHTKFFPDAGFGMLKRLTKVGCLDDIVAVVRSSAMMNYAQLVGDQQGNVIVQSYNWIEHFEPHIIKTALKGIKKMALFRSSSDSPGYVFVKSSSDAIIERKIKLLKDT